jgi:hypothetical protein
MLAWPDLNHLREGSPHLEGIYAKPGTPTPIDPWAGLSVRAFFFHPSAQVASLFFHRAEAVL